MSKKITRELFVSEGAKGGKKKNFNYRLGLINELAKLVDKFKLNFYMEYSKHDFTGKLLREALDVERKLKEEKKHG